MSANNPTKSNLPDVSCIQLFSLTHITVSSSSIHVWHLLKREKITFTRQATKVSDFARKQRVQTSELSERTELFIRDLPLKWPAAPHKLHWITSIARNEASGFSLEKQKSLASPLLLPAGKSYPPQANKQNQIFRDPCALWVRTSMQLQVRYSGTAVHCG